MDPNQIRQQKAEFLAQAKAIQSELDDENSDLTDEQRTKREAKVDDLIKQAEAKENEAKQIEAREAQSRQRAERMHALEQSGNAGRRTAPDDPGESAQPRITGGEPQFVNDPMKGFSRPREFFQQVIHHGSGDARSATDERMRYLAAAGGDEHGTHSDPHMGFFVPEGMSPEVLSTEADGDPLSPRTTQIPMDSPTVNVDARVDKNHSDSVSGGLTVSRRAETAAMNASRMEFEKVKLEANSLYGFSYATEELITDSPRSVAAIIEAGFGEEFASRRIMDLIDGTGVGEPLGVMNSPALITVDKEGSQTADTITGANVLAMRARAWRYQNCIWLANHDTYEQLAQVHIDGTNTDVFLFNPARAEDVPDMLLGRPVFWNEYAKTLGEAGDLMLLDMTQYLFGLYQPLETAESIHVRFDRNERAFRFTLRDAGAPWWRSALTPKNGANTLSPFVVLEARD